jgi:hypothetical protein
VTGVDRDPNIIDAGNGIHVVDTGYMRPRLAASHIVIDGDRAADRRHRCGTGCTPIYSQR